MNKKQKARRRCGLKEVTQKTADSMCKDSVTVSRDTAAQIRQAY